MPRWSRRHFEVLNAPSAIPLQRAIELIEVASDEVCRIADRGQRVRDGAHPEDTGGPTKSSASGPLGVADAEQNVEARGNRQVAVGHDDHVDGRQASPPVPCGC